MRRAAWCAAGLACAILAAGCATQRRVDDGQVINGVAATAHEVPGGVAELSPSETVLLYNGEQLTADALSRPDNKAIINFFHLEEVKEKPSSGGGCFSCGGGGGFCSGSGPCKEPPKLSVAKLAEYDGNIAREISINVADLPPNQRTTVPVAFHFNVWNSGCGKARQVMLVDSLPAGFQPTGVELEDLSGPDGAVIFSAFFPLIIPGIILLATHHGALMKFDDIAWDVKQLGDKQVLVVSAKMNQKPLEQGDFFYLKVSGYLPVPHGGVAR